MNPVRAILRRTLWVVGLLLLAIVLPYQSPIVKYRTPPFGEVTGLEVTLPGIPSVLLSPGIVLIFFLTLTAFTVVINVPGSSFKGRKIFRRQNLLPLVTGLLFFITLYSGFVNVGFDTMKASARLTLGLLGFLLVIGNGGWSQRDRSEDPSVSFLSMAWVRLRDAVLSINPRTFMGVVFCIEFVAVACAAYFVFDRVPHIVDSIAQLFHAKIFAMGKLTVSSPAMPEFFEMVHMINNGQWYSQFPPGHAMLLVPGVLLGIPWLINPLLCAGTVVLIYKLGVELYGEAIGRGASLLAVVSPFLLFMSAEMMNHTSAMFFFVLFAFGFFRTLRTRSVLSAIIAGCGLGMLGCIRPYTAVALSLPILLYGAYISIRGGKVFLRAVLTFTATAGVFALLLLAYNNQTNGSPFLFGYQVLWGSGVLPGLGNAAWGEPLTFSRGIVNTLDNLLGLQKFVFEWPVPSMLPLAFLLMGGRVTSQDGVLLSASALLVLAYGFYWFYQWLYGPRFLFELTPLLILLTARGLQEVPLFLERFGGTVKDVTAVHARTALIVLIATLLGLAANVPGLIKEYRGYAYVDRSVLDAVEEQEIEHGIIFTRSNYGGVFPANAPDLKSGLIFVRDLGEEKNKALMELYRGYPFYRAFNSLVEPYRLNSGTD